MKVVLLNQYYAPDNASTAQLLSDLGSGLADAGHEVTAVASSRAYADANVRYPNHEVIDGVEVLRSWTTAFGRSTKIGRILDYLTYLLGAARVLLFRQRPDVVISLSTPPMIALLGWMLARLRGSRSIYWVMDVYPDLAFKFGILTPKSISGRLFSAISKFVLSKSDDVVALGDTMAERLRQSGANRVHVVHNWADENVIRPMALDQNRLRRQWQWSDKFVVLYSGNMGIAHEFETVLDAAELLQDDPNIIFSFIGSGPRKSDVEEEVKRRGLSQVEFRPYVPRHELGHSLTAPDVHLVTLREGMPGLLVPSKIYGILAAGRPTVYVGPEEGEIAEILAEGSCGTPVAIGDAAKLAQTLRDYAGDRARVEEQGRNARTQFTERFTRQHGLDAFQELIRGGTTVEVTG